MIIIGQLPISRLLTSLVHGESGDEIDNCGLFLEQRRRHIFCSGKLSTQQREHAESFLPKFSFSISWHSQAKSAVEYDIEREKTTRPVWAP